MIRPLPILYSFRRCPYAMRARMAIAVSGVRVELREIVLRDKPEAMIAASQKATVPVLVLGDGQVIDESIDIMHWALRQHDPEGWLAPGSAMDALIAANDGPFKYHLDRTKYPSRYPDCDAREQQAAADALLEPLEAKLRDGAFLFGETPSLADMAIFPFVRQFAAIDAAEPLPLPGVADWLARLVSSPRFTAVMEKYAAWKPGDTSRIFP
jgi:glutathione S-transferase